MNKGIYFKVYKKDIVMDVALLKHKGTNTYSYVNLTKGHICSCVFDTVEEAIADMEDRKKQGLIEGYEEIS